MGHMAKAYQNGRNDTLREILSMLQDPQHGGRTEAYETTVAFIKERLA